MGKNAFRALLFLGVVLAPVLVRAQAGGQLSFLVYHCSFVDASDSVPSHVQINLDLMQDGAAVENPTFSVTRVEGNSAISNADVTPTVLSAHSPIQLTMVLDLTDTFPLTQVKQVVSEGLNQLTTQDKVGVIGFGGDIVPLSSYDTDHNNFSNTILFNLQQQKGPNNRLYDAINQAVMSIDPNNAMRQVVLVITDSKRKPTGDAQTPDKDIISLAKSRKTQIFAIGLNTQQDDPDPASLSDIAQETGGYAWIYQGTDTRGTTLQNEFQSRWNSFMAALNAEDQLTIPATALGSATSSQQVTLNLVAALPNGSAHTDQISCPIKILNYSVAFSNLPANELLTEPRDVQVVVDPDIDPSHMSVGFWLNDQSVQKETKLTFHLDPAVMTAATNTLQVQVIDNQNPTPLASTSLVTFIVQRALQLQAVNENGATDGLSGTVRFIAAGPPDLKGKMAHFVLRAVNSTSEIPLDPATAPVGDNGMATLTIADIQAEYNHSFPGAATDVEALAYIEGDPGQRIAISQPLKITFGTPPTPPLSMALVAGGVSLALVLVHVVLWRQVQMQRARRLLEYPDNHPLPEMPPYVTVTHKGDHQTSALSNRTTQIGRGDSNEINLSEDSDISRQHGAILWRKRRWYYANRKSQVRSIINGKRVRGLRVVPLRDLSQIEIGEYLLIFHRSELKGDPNELQKTTL